jgi:hypothetical protein
MATWDAQMIHGCYCQHGYFAKPDRSGVLSYYCKDLACPLGDNPSTPTFEVQTLTCTATSGFFTLTYDDLDSGFDGVTANIAFDATAATLEAALETLTQIRDVTVTYDSGAAACSGSGVAVAITFTTELGDLNALVATTVDTDSVSTLGGGTVTVAETTKGTETQNFETQTLTCTTTSGTFTLTFRQGTTAVLI